MLKWPAVFPPRVCEEEVAKGHIPEREEEAAKSHIGDQGWRRRHRRSPGIIVVEYNIDASIAIQRAKASSTACLQSYIPSR